MRISQIHWPKPLHGWREFLAEISIIVIGVLLALGAQQAVDAWNWRSEVSAFRTAVDHELSLDLGTYQHRFRQADCVSRRLDQLDAWLQRSKTGPLQKLLRPIGRPMMLSQYSSVWENKDNDVTAHLSMKDRLQCAQMYDEFRTVNSLKEDERELWRSLADFDNADELNHEDRMRLGGLISRARSINELLNGNYVGMLQLASAAGLRPVSVPNTGPPDTAFCMALIPTR